MRSRKVVVGLGALVALGLGVASFAFSGSERHADGDGPLASLDQPGGSMMAVNPHVPGVVSWTFGVPLCLASGTSAPVIDSVGPTIAVGTGFQFLGASIRQFDPTASHTPIISTDGYPPPPDMVPDVLRDYHHFVVTTPCTHDPRATTTELLIGLGITSDDGGGWRGVDVGYTVGGRHRILAVNERLFICGTSVAQECAGPPSPSNP